MVPFPYSNVTCSLYSHLNVCSAACAALHDAMSGRVLSCSSAAHI